MIEIAELVRGLAQRIESLAREIMPAGRKEGGAEWRDADAPAGKGSSLYVHLTGSKAGVWSHFSAGVSGDALDLVAYVKFGGDKKQAYHWAAAWLGLWQARPNGRVASETAGSGRSHSASPVSSAPGPSDANEIAREAKRRRWAHALFLGGQEKIAGTAADWYLKARAIDIARLGRQPGALRFDPACRYPESLSPCAGAHPALLAQITGPEGEFFAIHRTYLEIYALGRAGKLSTVPKAKLAHGRFAGGLVRLWRGTVWNEETGEIKDAPRLGVLGERRAGLAARGWRGNALREIHLTEGIENALTLAVECQDYRVAAAVSIANLGRVRLPEAIERVVIWADNDPEKDKTGARHSAQKGLERAIYWHVGHGKQVEIRRAPQGKDINDYIRGAA